MSQRSGSRYVLKKRPKQYPRTKQQQKILAALEFCGIKKGISKKELQEKMANCMPQYFRDHKEEK